MRTSSDVAIPKPRIIVGDGTEWVKQQCKVGTDFGKRRPPMPTPDTEARRAAEWMRSEDEKWKRRHAARVMALASAVEAIREEGREND